MSQEILRGALEGMTLLTAENELKAYECDALTVFTRPLCARHLFCANVPS